MSSNVVEFKDYQENFIEVTLDDDITMADVIELVAEQENLEYCIIIGRDVNGNMSVHSDDLTRYEVEDLLSDVLDGLYV